MRRAKNFDRNIYDRLVVNILTTNSSVTTPWNYLNETQ
jgi:hypothetical protein